LESLRNPRIVADVQENGLVAIDDDHVFVERCGARQSAFLSGLATHTSSACALLFIRAACPIGSRLPSSPHPSTSSAGKLCRPIGCCPRGVATPTSTPGSSR